jgi:hypothetical protein
MIFACLLLHSRLDLNYGLLTVRVFQRLSERWKMAGGKQCGTRRIGQVREIFQPFILIAHFVEIIAQTKQSAVLN